MAFLTGETMDRWLRAALWMLLAAGVALFAAVASGTLQYPHELAVSEGAVGLGVESVVDGEPMYGDSHWLEAPYVILHYTPLYYLLAALVSLFTGPGFLAGRIVSTLCTAATAVVAGRIAYERYGRLAPALAAGAIWLSFYQVVFWGTIQRVDAPGILFEALGLLIWFRARARGRTGYGALPLLVAAWATKQVMVVGLIACAVDLFLEDRRSALRFAAAGFGAILLLFGILTLWSGGGFWTATVLATVSKHADPPWVIFSNAELFFGSPWNVLLLILGTWAAWLRPGGRFLGLYLWIGMALAIATDANLPRFFPPMLAMALLVPAFLAERDRAPEIARAVLFALVLTAAVHLPYEMRSLVRERILTAHEGNERLQFAEAVRRHTRPDGKVLAQDVGMLMSAGRPVILADPLVFSIMIGNGAWDPAPLVDGIVRREYEAVILNRPLEALQEDEWTTLWIYPARDALAEEYRLAEKITIWQTWRFLEPTRYVYVPRETE